MLCSEVKAQPMNFLRNNPQHTWKKLSTKISTLQTTPDQTNLPKTKVKVMQRVNTLTTILQTVAMTEMTGMV